ncbi:MAG TPA: GNAT family N-acetyltransferase [Pyrinomonadaceae bacterium]|nr:GNAT family N-acetyltransferase [Pyrinomonadaceae bacterium]
MKKDNAVTNNQEKRRFEMPLADGAAAFISYEETSRGVLTFAHTEVPEEYEGQGIGSALVAGALEIVQAENLKIAPACPFVAAYLRRHPEYQSLVA